MKPTLEQQARDILERCGWEDAQRCTAGDVVEVANLLRDVAMLKAETILLAVVTKQRDELRAVVQEMGDGDNPGLWGELVKQRDEALAEVERLRRGLGQLREHT